MQGASWGYRKRNETLKVRSSGELLETMLLPASDSPFSDRYRMSYRMYPSAGN